MYLFAIIGAALMIIAVVWYTMTQPSEDEDDDYESDRDWYDDRKED